MLQIPTTLFMADFRIEKIRCSFPLKFSDTLWCLFPVEGKILTNKNSQADGDTQG